MREFLHVRNPRFDIAVHLLDASHLPKKLHIALYDSKDWLQTSVGIWKTLSGRLNLQNVYTHTHTNILDTIHKEIHGEHLLAIQNWKTGKETPQYKTDCKRCNWGVTHGGRNKNSETIERTPAGRNGQRLTTTRLSSYTSTEVLLSSQKGISGARKVR